MPLKIPDSEENMTSTLEARMSCNSFSSKLSISWERNQSISFHRQYRILLKPGPPYTTGSFATGVHGSGVKRTFIVVITQLLILVNEITLWAPQDNDFIYFPCLWDPCLLHGSLGITVQSWWWASFLLCWFWRRTVFLVAQPFPEQLKDLCDFSCTPTFSQACQLVIWVSCVYIKFYSLRRFFIQQLSSTSSQ